MNAKCRSVLAALFFVMITACGLPANYSDDLAGKVGNLPQGWALIAKASINAQLKDPMSAVYEIQPPSPGYSSAFTGHQPGWLVTGKVNAKNSYGGYTGFKRFYVLLQNGQVAESLLE